MLALKIIGVCMIFIAVMLSLILIAICAMKMFDKWDNETDENL